MTNGLLNKKYANANLPQRQRGGLEGSAVRGRDTWRMSNNIAYTYANVFN